MGHVGTEKCDCRRTTVTQPSSEGWPGGNNKEIVPQLDAFLRPNVDGEGSLMSKITSLDAQLKTARDRILRISS